MGSHYAGKLKKESNSRAKPRSGTGGRKSTRPRPEDYPGVGTEVYRTMSLAARLPLFSDQFKDSSSGPGLTVSHPTSPQEKAADAVADKVVSSPVEEITKKSSSLSEVQREASAGSGAGSAESATLDPGTAGEIQGLRGKGSPLSEETRSFMESHMGADLGEVRVHTGSRAEELSDRLQAKAFTYGNDIVFNKGEYSPGTGEGKRLLAHELAHTVQQGGGEKSIQRVTRNETTEVIFVKPGGGPGASNAVPVLPGQASVDVVEVPNRFGLPNNEDGLSIPHIRPGEVYKIPDGYDSVVRENGDVELTMQNGMEARFIPVAWAGSFLSGWKGVDFLHELWIDGDKSWDKLFARAGFDVERERIRFNEKRQKIEESIRSA